MTGSRIMIGRPVTAAGLERPAGSLQLLANGAYGAGR